MMDKKGLWTWLAAAALCLAGSSAWALDPVASNNTGVFTVRVTPNVDLGVTVDTTGAAWAGDTDLDVDMDLGAEKILGTGVKLTVAGNFQNQEFALTGADGATWLLDTDETPNEDRLRMYGLIGADQATAPSSALFNGVPNLITTVQLPAGQVPGDEAGDTNHKFEFSTGQAPQYAQIDNMAVGQIRRLWLRTNTPPTSTTDVQQAIVITVTALSGGPN